MPGGMAACSRWLSVAIPPDEREDSSHPEGDASAVASGQAVSHDLAGTPAGEQRIKMHHSGGIIRFADSTTGYKLSSLRDGEWTAIVFFNMLECAKADGERGFHREVMVPGRSENGALLFIVLQNFARGGK